MTYSLHQRRLRPRFVVSPYSTSEEGSTARRAVHLAGEAPSDVVVASVLALALLSTAVAYLLYFGLIQRVGPTKATMVTYLSPAFGIL